MIRVSNVRLGTILLHVLIGLFLWRQIGLTPSQQKNPDPQDDKVRNNHNRNDKQKKTSNRQFAYASLIGGVDPANPSYRGFLYNVLLQATLLREHYGSTKADYCLLIQMSYNTPATTLPATDLEWLRASHIDHVEYIPKSPHQGFYDINMQKFRVLQWVQYQRVLFLDADVMPLANLEYLFDMMTPQHNVSLPPLLKENLIVAGTQEPGSGGFFVLSPGPHKWQQLQDVISQRERDAQHATTPNKFDIDRGWGHTIQPPDQWVTTTRHRKGTPWTFHGADADQGLLYHWTKYHQQSVSIVIHKKVQNWGSHDATGNVYLEMVLERPFRRYNHTIAAKWATGPPPYRHYHHFTGRTKPWEQPQPQNTNDNENPLLLLLLESPEHYWFHHLNRLNQKLHLFDDWEAERKWFQKPPLGRFQVPGEIAQRVDRTNNAIQ